MDLWSVGRDVVMVIITVLVFYWGRDRKQTADLIDTRFERMRDERDAEFTLRDQRFDEHSRRIDQIVRMIDGANTKSSELTGYVQGLVGRLDRFPEELRGKFLPNDRATDLLDESRRDRAQLWKAIEDLKRDREQIWNVVERRQKPRDN